MARHLDSRRRLERAAVVGDYSRSAQKAVSLLSGAQVRNALFDVVDADAALDVVELVEVLVHSNAWAVLDVRILAAPDVEVVDRRQAAELLDEFFHPEVRHVRLLIPRG